MWPQHHCIMLWNVTVRLPCQGVYKFNWTNFQEIPGGISRKIQDMFALLRPAMQCTESTSLPKYRTRTWYAQHGAVAKIRRATSFLNKRCCTQFHHNWKPMQSIIDILHKNFQEDHTNSRFPGFPGVVDTLHVQLQIGPATKKLLTLIKASQPNTVSKKSNRNI